MSFDLTFLAPANTTVSVQAVAAWLANDARVGQLSGREDSFEAVTAIGGAPWAAFLVEDISDLDPDDRTVEGAPENLRQSGVRLEISYSAPEPVVTELFSLAATFAEQFDLVVTDEQADAPRPVSADELRASWIEAEAIARAAFEEHSRRDL